MYTNSNICNIPIYFATSIRNTCNIPLKYLKHLKHTLAKSDEGSERKVPPEKPALGLATSDLVMSWVEVKRHGGTRRWQWARPPGGERRHQQHLDHARDGAPCVGVGTGHGATRWSECSRDIDHGMATNVARLDTGWERRHVAAWGGWMTRKRRRAKQGIEDFCQPLGPVAVLAREQERVIRTNMLVRTAAPEY
jgi:hypothetical protein